MDIIPFAYISGDNHRSVGDGEGFELSLAKFCPAAFGGLVFGFHKGGKLNIQEGEIALIPFLSPVGYQSGKKFMILRRISAGIGFTLIPDCALDGVIEERGNLSVK